MDKWKPLLDIILRLKLGNKKAFFKVWEKIFPQYKITLWIEHGIKEMPSLKRIEDQNIFRANPGNFLEIF